MRKNKRSLLPVTIMSLMLFWGLSLQPAGAQSSEDQTSDSTNQAAPLKDLDTYIHKVMKRWQVPGLAIAVVKDGKVVLSKGYGVRELGKPGKVDANTLFTIGSNSKAFTAAALGTLVSAGKLTWDAPVTNYVKDFKLSNPYVTQHITLRDLLTHRSGYSDPFMKYTSDVKDAIKRLRYQKPDYDFRTRFSYNNSMYWVASRFIPSVTGESWNNYTEEHLFKPLNMTRTVTTQAGLAATGNVAKPHGMVDGKLQVIHEIWSHNADIEAPAGYINSSARDMSHWLLMLLNNGRYGGKTVLAPSVVRDMETPQVLIHSGASGVRFVSPDSHFYAYGMGFFIEDYGGHKLVWHTGDVAGMISALALVPDEHLGVVVLTNLNGNDPFGVLFHVLQSYLGLPPRDLDKIVYAGMHKIIQHARAEAKKLADTRQPDSKLPHPLTVYAGNYKDNFNGKADVSIEKNHLVLRLGNPDFTGDLKHWHDNTFRVTWRDRFYDSDVLNAGVAYVTFDLDAYGKPVKLSFAKWPLHFKRVKEAKSTAEAK